MTKKLLIVDDEKNIADLLCETFEEEGISAFAAYSGHDALRVLKEQTIDLILSDIQMPNGTGIDLLDAINDLSTLKKPKVILMSGYTDWTKEELIKKGALEILNKPVDIEYLISTIMNHLEQSSSN